MERNRCILLNMALTLYDLITEPRPGVLTLCEKGPLAPSVWLLTAVNKL